MNYIYSPLIIYFVNIFQIKNTKAILRNTKYYTYIL